MTEEILTQAMLDRPMEYAVMERYLAALADTYALPVQTIGTSVSGRAIRALALGVLCSTVCGGSGGGRLGIHGDLSPVPAGLLCVPRGKSTALRGPSAVSLGKPDDLCDPVSPSGRYVYGKAEPEPFAAPTVPLAPGILSAGDAAIPHRRRHDPAGDRRLLPVLSRHGNAPAPPSDVIRGERHLHRAAQHIPRRDDRQALSPYGVVSVCRV